MGCCCSWLSGGENKSQSGEPNERTTLLGNPVSNNAGRQLFGQDFPEVVTGALGDEQAALNKILHQTQIDIIDVSAIPTHIEQKDYIDRVGLYQRKLVSIRLGHSKNQKNLLRDLPHPEKLLSGDAMQLADYQMMDDAFKSALRALQGIEVEPRDDLVSKFGLS